MGSDASVALPRQDVPTVLRSPNPPRGLSHGSLKPLAIPEEALGPMGSDEPGRRAAKADDDRGTESFFGQLSRRLLGASPVAAPWGSSPAAAKGGHPPPSPMQPPAPVPSPNVLPLMSVSPVASPHVVATAVPSISTGDATRADAMLVADSPGPPWLSSTSGAPYEDATTLPAPREEHTIEERQLIVEAAEATISVISSRSDVPRAAADGTPLSYDGLTPLAVSDVVKSHIEWLSSGVVRCFNPNRDSVVTDPRGGAAAASGDALKRWIEELERARKTGGCVLRIDLEEAGMSSLQEAETHLATQFHLPLVVVSFNARSTVADVTRQLEAGDSGMLRAELSPGYGLMWLGLHLVESPREREVRQLRTYIGELQGRNYQLLARNYELEVLNSELEHARITGEQGAVYVEPTATADPADSAALSPSAKADTPKQKRVQMAKGSSIAAPVSRPRPASRGLSVYARRSSQGGGASRVSLQQATRERDSHRDDVLA